MRYFQRSIKYFISRCCFFLLLLYALSFTSFISINHDTNPEGMYLLTGETRGLILIMTIAGISILYPFMGFVRRRVQGSLKRDRNRIIEVFASQRMRFKMEREGALFFVETSGFQRFLKLYEDQIKVCENDNGELVITGDRKRASQISFILERALSQNNKKNKEKKD